MTVLPSPSLIFSDYYLHPDHSMPQHPYPPSMPVHHQDQHISQSMQPPPSPSIPIDPALSLYSPSYYAYQAPHPQFPQQLSLGANLSSPSSQASDSISTPPTEQLSFAGSSKRSSSALLNDAEDHRKRSRKNDDGGILDKDEPKAKPTRGSRSVLATFYLLMLVLMSRRACTVCRRLKMKCVGAEQGPPCKRCQTGNHECIFEESNRGKRSSK